MCLCFFSGLKEFQAKRERQRKEKDTIAAAKAAEAETTETTESTPTTTTLATDTNENEIQATESDNKTPKSTEEITSGETAKAETAKAETAKAETAKAETKKEKKIVLKANAPSFTPAPMRTPQPPPMQTMPPPNMVFTNYQHAAYPPGPHYAARAHGPNASVHRASMYSQQRFPTSSRHPGFAPRGYPPSHNYMQNPPRTHTMPPNAMHPQRMVYSAGHGPPHNRNGIGGMHHA